MAYDKGTISIMRFTEMGESLHGYTEDLDFFRNVRLSACVYVKRLLHAKDKLRIYVRHPR